MEAATQPAPAHTWPSVAIVNDESSGVSDADAQAMGEAVAHQVLYDFGPRWNAGAHFSFYGVGKKAPAGSWTVVLLDSSDQAGALGYHDLTPDGLPLGKVFAGTDRQYGETISVTLSHEVLEMLADPWIDLAAQSDDGKFYAWECSDAVEDDSLAYDVAGVKVSAFVTPSWFGHGAGQTAFQVADLQAFELAPGGYISVFDPASGQGWQQVTAEQAPTAPPGTLSPARSEWEVDHDQACRLLQSVPRVGSRRERRFRGRGRWVLSTYESG